MKTLHIIFNVSARSGKTRKLWRELKGILKEREIDFKAYRTLREGHATQIARELSLLADEAVFSPADALSILQRHAADYLNIKLMKTGGIWQALKICNAAEVYGAKCMVGCMLESKLAVSAAAHLAAARGVVTMVDLDGPSLCSTDPYTGGPLYNEGTILMNETPGIGITGVPGFEVAQ